MIDCCTLRRSISSIVVPNNAIVMTRTAQSVMNILSNLVANNRLKPIFGDTIGFAIIIFSTKMAVNLQLIHNSKPRLTCKNVMVGDVHDHIKYLCLFVMTLAASAMPIGLIQERNVWEAMQYCSAIYLIFLSIT